MNSLAAVVITQVLEGWIKLFEEKYGRKPTEQEIQAKKELLIEAWKSPTPTKV